MITNLHITYDKQFLPFPGKTVFVTIVPESIAHKSATLKFIASVNYEQTVLIKIYFNIMYILMRVLEKDKRYETKMHYISPVTIAHYDQFITGTI